jgi:4-hydroxy-3-methylbut-2-enyl diphosphate reductase
MMNTAIRTLKEIHLASTQGFCAGVASAIEVVERALVKYGKPLYVRHHIVHNTTVICDLESKGVVFIEALSEVPKDHVVIFSAHGTAPVEYERAKLRGLKIIDATCPLVTKIHRQSVRFSEQGVQTILIGHHGHQELIGTSGYVDSSLLHIIETEEDIDKLSLDSSRPIGYLTQTTLSVSDTEGLIQKLRQKYPSIKGAPKADICFATTNRQNAVQKLAVHCDLIIVCGSPHSSNSNRLRECAAAYGVDSYIIDTVVELDFSWFDQKTVVGITSGASVPQSVVDETVSKIKDYFGPMPVYQEDNIEGSIRFPIPNI